MQPAPFEPSKFTALVGQFNTDSLQPHFPQLPPKHDTQIMLEPSKSPSSPLSGQARTRRTKKLDSKAGLTVIGVTLAVMVFYGRAAALIGLCACFFLAAINRRPVVTEVFEGKMAVGGYADFHSEEYKKRVVLEGLLDRSKPKSRAHVEDFRAAV